MDSHILPLPLSVLASDADSDTVNGRISYSLNPGMYIRMVIANV